MKFNLQVKSAYNELKTKKDNSGKFYKTLFHIHTPQSHDYSLLEEWNYSEYHKKSDNDIYEVAKNKIKGIDCLKISDIKEDSLKYGYSNYKEYLSYSILANELYLQEIGCVIVSDHNTIKGIKKLEKSIELLKSIYPNNIYPHVFNGVEISCADKLHVVVVFDNKRTELVENWLKNNIIDEKSGTYETSLNVLSYFSEEGLFCYIAHINSSDLFKEEYLAFAYKKRLLESKLIQFLGVSKCDSIDTVNNNIRNYNKKIKVKYILDNDSHNIDNFKNNIMWIKGSKRNYEMLIEAFLDYDTSIRLGDITIESKSFIKGIYIPNDNQINHFLVNKDKKSAYSILFSSNLNCFIGGRGTGKSTTLNILQYGLTQKVKSERELEFICRNPNIFILYELDTVEYIIEMGIRSIYKESVENSVLQKFGQNKKNSYYYRYNFDYKEIQKIARNQDLNIYRVIDKGKKFKKENNKYKLLEKMFDTVYSVNELVKKADNDEMTEFIYSLLLKNKELSKPTINTKKTKFRSILEMINKIEKKRRKRLCEVNKIIDLFNDKNQGRLKIYYEQNENLNRPNFKNWFFDDLRECTKKYRITPSEIIYCLEEIYDDLGFYKFFSFIIERKYKEIAQYFFVFFEQSKIKNNMDLIPFKEENISNFIDIIFSLFDNVSELKIKSYINGLGEQEELRLEYNINLKVSSKNDKKEVFKDIRDLSQGQKVVAMIDFILAYSDYVDDYRPLIIDQPEDNLDTRYIYLSLVKQLRDVKDKRQIIIATHNATIVTNSVADKVFVMESDGECGWIEMQGYPGEKKIKEAIVNYLEGGIDSFKHKQEIYKNILSD